MSFNSKIFFFSLLFVLAVHCSAQRFADQVPQIKRYDQKDILDTTEGIKLYNKLIESIGGDSVTYNKSGYNLQGWNEDYYANGKLLHRGYYVDGKLIVFKNFFENGQLERTVANPDPMRCNMEVFYEDGKQRKQISYFNGLPQKKYEYYQNGYPKYAEENEKDMKYLTSKKSWFSNGQMEQALELTDVKHRKYNQKFYYPNGQVKEEGTLVLSSDGKEYLKDGVWHFYDQVGKKEKTEKYNSGKPNSHK
jgi:antitoxin component YwqK of YwqJK toxin-antitoxin module